MFNIWVNCLLVSYFWVAGFMAMLALIPHDGWRHYLFSAFWFVTMPYVFLEAIVQDIDRKLFGDRDA